MRPSLLAAATVTALALGAAGCAEDSSGSGSSAPTSTSVARHATVLDARVDAVADPLPAVTVDLAGHRVGFDADEPLRIAFNGYGKGFDYSAPEFEAAEDAVEEYDVDVDTFDPAGDPQRQIAQVQDAMASGKYNAMVVYPLSTDLMCDIMTKQMPAAGIVPVAIGNPPCADGDSAGILTVVPDTGGTDYVYPAWADLIAEREEGGRAVLITGPEIDFTSKMATDAITDSFASHDIDLVAVQRTDFTQEDALQKAQDILQANPDITTIVSSFPEGTHAAVTALRIAGRTDDVDVYDFGGARRILQDIEGGLVDGSSPFYPYTKTKAAIQALVLARAGEPVDDLLPYAGHAEEPLRSPGDKIMFITGDNVADFEADIAEY